MEISPLIATLPKVELHLHIEGTFEPELMFAIAERNGIKLSYETVEALKAAYDFSDLQSFLDLYYQGMGALQTEQDYFDLTWAYLSKCQEQNVQHVEIFWDPQGHTQRGIAFEVPLNGIEAALKKGQEELGISYGLIMSFLRHLSEEEGFATLEQAKPHKDRILGVGLDSSELGHPPEKFERLFAACKEEGFKLMAHGGEEGPPEYVSGALDALQIDRLDHGNRSMEDPALVQRLVDQRMCLTVCPLSNVRLKNCPDMSQHPIKAMLDAGLLATIHSDDPAYFGGYMNENYQAVVDALSLERKDIITLAHNAVVGSFASDERKAELADSLLVWMMES